MAQNYMATAQKTCSQAAPDLLMWPRLALNWLPAYHLKAGLHVKQDGKVCQTMAAWPVMTYARLA